MILESLIPTYYEQTEQVGYYTAGARGPQKKCLYGRFWQIHLIELSPGPSNGFSGQQEYIIIFLTFLNGHVPQLKMLSRGVARNSNRRVLNDVIAFGSK